MTSFIFKEKENTAVAADLHFLLLSSASQTRSTLDISVEYRGIIFTRTLKIGLIMLQHEVMAADE